MARHPEVIIAAGSLRSLHQFMLTHRNDIALRLDPNPPSFQEVATQMMTAEGKRSVRYRRWSLPLYLAERAVELMDTAVR